MAAMNNVIDLKPFKSMWKVRVKIIRLWKQYSTASGETIEMVFWILEFTQIKCLAYGNVAQQLHDFWTSNDAYVVLCVLQFWRIAWGEGGFNNVTTIEGFSKILFDPEDVQEIQAFRKKIPNTAF